MAESKEEKSTQEKNFDAARETAQRNHDNHVKQNTVDGNEGVEVRELKPVEVINPVRNNATGELEDDTRTLKQSHEEALGLEDSSDSGSTKSESTKNESSAQTASNKPTAK